MIELVDPQGKVFKLKYYEVNDFCKSLCSLNENKEKFAEFKKSYTYFDAYFDFVIFELNYKMQNYLLKNELIHCRDNQIYSSIQIEGYNMPCSTKCSDDILQIKKVTKKTPTAIIDPNGMQMMSFLNEDERGSHVITARTILNQMLIKNENIYNYYTSYLNKKTGADTFLMNIGFMRSLDKEYIESIICKKDLLTEEVLNQINSNKIIDMGPSIALEQNLRDEYLSLVKKTKKAEKSR